MFEASLKRFKHKTFNYQLTVLFVFGLTLLALTSSMITTWTTGFVVTEDFRDRAERIAAEIASQSTLALLYESEENAKEVFERFKTFPSFEFGSLLQPDQKLLYEYGNKVDIPLTKQFSASDVVSFETENYWQINAPVIDQNQESEGGFGEETVQSELLGYVSIILNKRELKAIKQSIVYSNILIALLVSMILIIVLQKLVQRLTKPLQTLSETMQKAENKESGLSVELSGAKELVTMGHAFNKMISALEERETNLVKEISARKKIESALRESEQRYRVLTTVSPVGVFYADLDGKYLYANERWHNMTEVEHGTADDKIWFETVYHEDFDKVKEEWNNAVSEQTSFKAEFRYLNSEGHTTWVLGEATPETDSEGKIKTYVGTMTDMTKRHEAEDRVRQHQLELAHVARLKTMGEMASGMAHELNQPLAAIVNYAGGCMERLKAEDISPDILDAMDRINIQAERAGEIIHRLKDFLRKKDANYEGIDVNECLRGVTKLIEIETKSQSVTLKLDLAQELPMAQIDKVHFEQVVMNLSQNAIDAMSAVNEEKRFLMLSTQFLPETEEVFIKIQDSGPGIASEIKDKVFDPFFTTKSAGMGMGLSIVSSIIENHEGRIEIDSEPGQGTAFLIYLPKEHKE